MKYVLAIAAAFLIVGCGSSHDNNAPPKIAYGRDECAHCGMIINDDRHAAALRATVDGRSQDLLFDDIGDMVAYEREHADRLKVTRRFVHDYETREWRDADAAYYLRSERVHTPMGSGIVALADAAAAARRQQADGGQSGTFAAIRAGAAASGGDQSMPQ
jgi:copper chaperone NosL